MQEFFTQAFLVISGSFLFGFMIYIFYIGLKPDKKKPEDKNTKAMPVKKQKAKLI